MQADISFILTMHPWKKKNRCCYEIMELLFILKIDVEIWTVIINSSTVVDTGGQGVYAPLPSL